jgi:hypothetical protein
MFLANPPQGWLLGDSGYGIEPWLLTPFSNNRDLSEAEERYQKAFVKTRRIVENTIGLWKNIFRCLLENKLHYRPERVIDIIAATVFLHNLRRRLKLREDEAFIANLEPVNDQIPVEERDAELTRIGNNNRDHLVRNYFQFMV